MLRDDTMEALSSVFEDYKTGDEAGSSQAPSYMLGDSDWALIDGDTAKNLKTGQRVRVGNIDTREVGRVISEGADAGFKHGEVGGELATLRPVFPISSTGFSYDLLRDLLALLLLLLQ